ncbi:MAG: hypothetical protein ACUVX8_11875 [Candidatus Zipacnadales bacterium]
MRLRALLCATVLFATALGGAQDYRFSVPELLLELYPNADASLRMEYTVVLRCSEHAHPIDVIDVGLPHQGYDLANMSASINDLPISGIAKSTYIDCGVEVPLGAQAIQPGQTGIFKFTCTMPDMVYQDTTRQDYASLQVGTTWWGAEFVEGFSKVAIVAYLPAEIKPEEVVHQGDEFSFKATKGQYTMVGWFLENVRVDQQYKRGLSYPKRVQQRVVVMTPWKLFRKWWIEQSNVRVAWAILLFVLYGIVFFRASRGTGISVFVFLLIGMLITFVVWPMGELLAILFLPFIWYLAEKALQRKRGKYLPAIMSVEGGGIKRGLAAPEAAIILELPLGQVLTLIIFGLLKKRILRQLQEDPLEVELAPEYVGKTHQERLQQARHAGTVIRAYEQPFLDEIEAHPGHPLNQIDFSSAIKNAVEITARKMKGFDLERTRSYYRYIVSRAWAEAKAIGDLEKRTEYTDDNLLWLLLAPNSYDDFNSWHRSGYHYHTPWMRTAPIGGRASTSPTAVGGKTTFTDVSRSFAGWAENITGGLASKMDPVSVGLKSGGLLKLSGVDRVTMNVLEALAESSGSGGGGGGGCACAGCACACACAGGGR